ncbi:MAG: hypothetical protein ABI406_07975 [Ktedonobacteraceae bacterium]
MKQHSFAFIFGIVVSLVLGFGIIAGVALALRANWGLGYEPSPGSAGQAQKTGPNSATLSFGTFPDSMACHPNADTQQSQWVSYCPTTSFEVPPNSVITVIVSQYDSATTLINPYFQQVRGTVGGTMVVNGKTMNQIGADAPGHTFTLQSPPDTTYPLFVSVPLLGVSSNDPSVNVTLDGNQFSYPKPNIISFQFRTGPAGTTYIWHCYVPCGNNREAPYGFSGPMSTTGFMAGSLTVANY